MGHQASEMADKTMGIDGLKRKRNYTLPGMYHAGVIPIRPDPAFPLARQLIIGGDTDAERR